MTSVLTEGGNVGVCAQVRPWTQGLLRLLRHRPRSNLSIPGCGLQSFKQRNASGLSARLVPWFSYYNVRLAHPSTWTQVLS